MNGVAVARLLIVDDEAAQMRALRDTLHESGYETVGFTNGEDALAALKDSSFDVLLADLTMPRMDGITLLREALRTDPMLAGVIMTGNGTITTAVQAMQNGAFDYILKPFKLSAVLPVLSRALAMRRLRVANAALEQRIRERSAELEAANTELDAFTRSASHDLRTPLNAVMGFTELLTTSCAPQLSAQGQEWLAHIGAAGHRMTRLIDDLLRLSRSGRQALQLAPVDLSRLVGEVAEEAARASGAGPGVLRIGELPRVTADESLMRQVYTNLLSNALKFTRRSEQPAIDVGCHWFGDERVFFVRDNGAGFDMADAGRLFSAFERLHSEQEYDGTGVGLSIVQRVVQRHGGRIWAEAEPGRGATFNFTLAQGSGLAPVPAPP